VSERKSWCWFQELGVGLDRLVPEIVGLNPAYGMDICHFSVLCCPV
jgi:hypothetical protein